MIYLKKNIFATSYIYGASNGETTGVITFAVNFSNIDTAEAFTIPPSFLFHPQLCYSLFTDTKICRKKQEGLIFYYFQIVYEYSCLNYFFENWTFVWSVSELYVWSRTSCSAYRDIFRYNSWNRAIMLAHCFSYVNSSKEPGYVKWLKRWHLQVHMTYFVIC